jgi:hypothetical protein
MRGVAVTAALVASSLVVGWAVVFAMYGVIASLPAGDLPPEGPACDYETDPGSGYAGTSEEQMEWWPLPRRVCPWTETSTPVNGSVEVTMGTYRKTGAAILLWPVGLAAAIWAFVIGRRIIASRATDDAAVSPRRRRAGEGSPT